MSETNQIHWDNTICQETLEALAYSRAEVLMGLGFDPQAARMFAVLEQERRQSLAKEIGADAALLASLEWNLFDKSFECRLVPDSLPKGLGDRFFLGFV